MVQQQQQLHRILSTFLLILTIIATSGVKRSRSAWPDILLTVVNSCQETVWPAVLTVPPIIGAYVNISGDGFELKPGESSSFKVPSRWSGEIWGQTGCDVDSSSNGTCQTGGSCGFSLSSCYSSKPPVTVAKFGFGVSNDFYEVSLAKGFNLPLAVIPINGRDKCRAAACSSDLRLNCSSELTLKSSAGNIIGCQSACQVLKMVNYCCMGDYATSETCKPINSKQFKEVCPTSYSYVFDVTSNLQCYYGSDYFVNFCPSSRSSTQSIAICEACANSGGLCTYNQTVPECIGDPNSSGPYCGYNRTVTECIGGRPNSGGLCTYNQTLPKCIGGRPSSNKTVIGGGPLFNKTVMSGVPTSNKTMIGGIPLRNGTHSDGLPLGRKIMIGVFAGVAVVGGLILLFFLFIYHKSQMKSRERMKTSNPDVQQFLETYGCLSLQRYKYKDIKRMTNSFKDKLGQGGYGSVFKGKLADGRLVAVKVLINDPKKGNGEEFMNEVVTIGSTNHINVVSLWGFCVSGSKRALVYQFMPNGSLEKFIYAKKENGTTATTSEITTATTTINAIHQLGWEKLYEIALGIARGLEYLHRGCNTGRILHFDIKPHNILLDEKFCPKISDFGLAKLCPTRESIVSMHGGGRGTLGYIAPEVYCRNFGGVSYKSDVYSYGMMVLEMVGGRKNIDPFVGNTSEIYFPHWIYDHLEDQDDKIEDFLRFEGEFEEEMARKMIMVGLWCIQTNPSHRPSMGRVAEMLVGRIEDLQMPPKPIVDLSSPPAPPAPPPPPPPPSTSSSSTSTSSSLVL